MNIEHFVNLDSGSRNHFRQFLNVLSFFSLSANQSSLDGVDSVGIQASTNGYTCNRILVFCLSEDITKEQSESLSLLLNELRYAAANPLIPFDVFVCVTPSSDRNLGPLRQFFCNADRSWKPTVMCRSVLAILPWLTSHDRLGHGIRIKLTQDTFGLHQLGGGNGLAEPVACAMDILSGIQSVMFGRYERSILPPSLQGHTSRFDELECRHEPESIRNLLENLQQVSAVDWNQLQEEVSRIDKSIMTSVFGRLMVGEDDSVFCVTSSKDYEPEGASGADKDCILFMTEQTSLCDILYAKKKYGTLSLLYSPLVIVQRFLTENVLKFYCSKTIDLDKVEYYYCPAYAPSVAEALIKHIIDATEKSMDIVGSGSETIFLTLLKLERSESKIRILESITS
ncbi:MAG: hypothetical protein ACTSV3_06545 [Candidatus Thorarchaeota archaeon]